MRESLGGRHSYWVDVHDHVHRLAGLSLLGGTMRTLAKVLVGLAALAFVFAVVTISTGPLMEVHPEGFSRACTNLLLMAIALVVTFEPRANHL
jgi:hypothetical protein